MAFLSLWAVVPIVLAVMAFRPLSERELRVFTGRLVALYGVELTQEALPVVKRSAIRGRVSRLSGAALGLSLYPVLYGAGVRIPNAGVVYAVIGYLLGAFINALVPASRPLGPRRASLVPRNPSDYLPRIALITPIIAFGVSCLAILVYELEPHRIQPNFSGTTAAPAISGIAAAATLIAVRVLVARAQPVTTSDLVAFDDALRTQAIHTIAAAGMAIALIGMASSLFEMGGHASFIWLSVVGIAGGFCTLIGVFFAWAFRSAEWHVHRPVLR